MPTEHVNISWSWTIFNRVPPNLFWSFLPVSTSMILTLYLYLLLVIRNSTTNALLTGCLNLFCLPKMTYEGIFISTWSNILIKFHFLYVITFASRRHLASFGAVLNFRSSIWKKNNPLHLLVNNNNNICK